MSLSFMEEAAIRLYAEPGRGDDGPLRAEEAVNAARYLAHEFCNMHGHDWAPCVSWSGNWRAPGAEFEGDAARCRRCLVRERGVK